MPNTGHITICPFYMSERSRAITCEDVFRRFRTKKEKDEYMKTYCDNQWEQCRYAQNLKALHERIEKKGDTEKMMEIFKNKATVTRDELKKITTQLGKAEAKVEKQDQMIEYLKKRDESAVKSIADLQEENQALAENIEKIRQKNKELFGKMMTERNKIAKKEQKMLDEMKAQALIYEGYVAYLMVLAGTDVIDSFSFYDWLKKHEYKVTNDLVKRTLNLEVKEKQDGDNRSAAEVPTAGDGETEQAEEASSENTGEETE